MTTTFYWTANRASGVLLLVVLAVTTCVGFYLAVRQPNRSYPRGLLVGVHQYLSVVGAALLGLHFLAALLDPFQRFGVAELVVPLLSHYRPLYVGVGVLAGEVLLVVGLTSATRSLTRRPWWRWVHRLALPAFVLAWVHGAGAGTDAGTPWGIALLVLTGGGVAAMGAWRAWVRLRSPVAEVATGVAVAAGLLGIAFAAAGPWQPGWNLVANGGHGSGARLTDLPGTSWPASFHDTVAASASVSGVGGSANVVLDGNGAGDLPLAFHIGASGASDADGHVSVDQAAISVVSETGAPLCQGDATALDLTGFSASCTGSGATVHITVRWALSGGQLRGTLDGTAARE